MTALRWAGSLASPRRYRPSVRNRIVIAVLAASAGWGLAGVGTRAAYGAGATTLSVLSIRTAVATIALLVYVLITGVRPTRLAWQNGILIGSLRIGITPLLFMTSLNYISSGVEGLVITLVPVTTAVLGAIFIKENITRRQIVGPVVGLAGTMLIGLAGDSGLGSEGSIVAGFAFALGGVLVGSATGVMQRHYAPRHDTVELALPMFVAVAADAVLLDEQITVTIGVGGALAIVGVALVGGTRRTAT